MTADDRPGEDGGRTVHVGADDAHVPLKVPQPDHAQGQALPLAGGEEPGEPVRVVLVRQRPLRAFRTPFIENGLKR